MLRHHWIFTAVLGAMALVAMLQVHGQAAGGFAPRRVATIDAKPITEISGMAKSLSYENTFWVVNDSGDTARLFAIRRDGTNILPTYSRFSYYGEKPEKDKKQWQGFKVLYADNQDWESMTIDDDYLYVADMGNNFNNRRDLGIYALSEIDATASTQSAAIRFLPVVYPDQREFPGLGTWHFDSEALFSADGKLYVITKHRKRSGVAYEPGANLYRLDTDYTDRDNVLVHVDHSDLMEAVTGAELSPDGQTLAVISYGALWLFDRPATGDKWLSSDARRYALDRDVVRQVETVVWDDDRTLLLTNEQRDLFRVGLDELAAFTP